MSMYGKNFDYGMCGFGSEVDGEALDGVDAVDRLADHASRQWFLRQIEKIEFHANGFWDFLLRGEIDSERQKLARFHFSFGLIDIECCWLEMPKVVNLHNCQISDLQRGWRILAHFCIVEIESIVHFWL